MTRISLCMTLNGGLPLVAAESGAYFPPADKNGGQRTLTDATQSRKTAGMDLNRLNRAFGFGKETSRHGGLVVVRHGYLVYEKYFGKGNREAHPDMASNGKAVTSISCGIMLNENKSLIPEGTETMCSQRNTCPKRFHSAIPCPVPDLMALRVPLWTKPGGCCFAAPALQPRRMLPPLFSAT
jgi:hypothetical protein